MAKAGRDFEEAVARFVAALDPSAQVLFDHKVPDRHTGTPRQVDVWINARFGGHIALAILVSCKDHARPLDIGDIGAFHGERESTGANAAVIYSASGFTQPAVAKAHALGITCCRLYRNQPSELPQSIRFDWYCCISRFHLMGHKPRGAMKTVRTWDDLFDMAAPDGQGTFLDLIQRAFDEQKDRHIHIVETSPDQPFPAGWETSLSFTQSGAPVLTLTISVTWRRYRARAEAVLLNGSYCHANDSFRGSQSTLAIDTWNPPGPGWTEMSDSEPTPFGRNVVLTLYHTDVKTRLREHLRGKPLPCD